LKDRGKWEENQVRVTFVPKGVGEANQPKAEVTFDRVSIWIDK